MRFPRIPAAVLLLCTACFNPAINSDPLDAQDSGVFSGSVRALLLPPETNRSEAPRVFGMEASTHSGEYATSLFSGEVIRLDNTPLPGPGEVHGSFSLTRITAFVQSLSNPDSRFRTRLHGGLSYTELEINANLAGSGEKLRTSAIGPTFGGQLETTITPSVDAFARLTWHFGIADSDKAIQSLLEIGTTWSIQDNLALSAGWHFNDFQMERDSNALSDIDLSFDGPFLMFEIGVHK